MRNMILRACALAALTALAPAAARAQSPAAPAESPAPPAADASAAPQAKTPGGLFALEEVERQLRAQREELEQLRAAVREQSRLIGELRTRVEDAERLAAARPAGPAVVRDAAYTDAAAAQPPGAQAPASGAAQPQGAEARVGRVEEQAKKTADAVSRQLGSMAFSGDLRFRYESLYGQQNASATPDVPGTFGNPLTSRQRLRLRARFAVRGRVGEEFEWGLRLVTGSYADAISTNQTLTDFFTRKPVGLDYAYLVYKPKSLPGFSVEAGKLDAGRRFPRPGATEEEDQLDAFWTRTEMTWDADLNPEGLMETYARAFGKGRTVRSLVLQAWQFPMLERNSAFVLGADGKVDLSASGRAGRDLALYGAQARTELALSDRLSLRLSAADLYFSGTQFITPAQVFGANIQFPATFTIPASGTTPARTVTAQVSVPRDLLVSGNANLGLSLANTNAVNRDGRLSSGYNLVDLIARLDYRSAKSSRWPVMLLFDFVTNTQTRDVVTAGPAGGDVLLPNDQGQGYWAEFRIGRDVLGLRRGEVERGDKMFDYTFTRVEKDAILSPFNGSDLGLSTDMRVHRFMAAYALDPKVAVVLTGFVTQRPTGLLGAFGQTPPGSLNRALTRLQFDTILRF